MSKSIVLIVLIGSLFGIVKDRYFMGNSDKIGVPSSTSTATSFKVVELFTSEGCSSCPPADDILRGLAGQDNVMALSFHVTYWNRLGWKDPFSQPEFDARQYQYGSYFKLNGVYTPQVVINGAAEMVGSRRAQIESEVSKENKNDTDFKIDLTTDLKDKKLTTHFKINRKTENKVLNIALVERNIETKVLRGENEGRTLKHDNVVRLFKTIKIASDTEGVMDFMLQADFKTKDCSIIAYLQDEKNMKIVAAAKLRL